jgi:hypothetical protein
VHVFNNSRVTSRLLLQRTTDFSFTSLISVEQTFCNFAPFSIRHKCPSVMKMCQEYSGVGRYKTTLSMVKSFLCYTAWTSWQLRKVCRDPPITQTTPVNCRNENQLFSLFGQQPFSSIIDLECGIRRLDICLGYCARSSRDQTGNAHGVVPISLSLHQNGQNICRSIAFDTFGPAKLADIGLRIRYPVVILTK